MPSTTFRYGWLLLFALLTRPAAAQQPALTSLPSVPAPPAAPQPVLTSLPAANQYHLKAIQLEDARSQVSARAIRLPTFSTPGRGDKVWPPLTAEQRAQLQTALQLHFRADSTRPAATLQCRLVEAYQLFMPTAKREFTSAYAAVELELLDEQGQLLMAATGQYEAVKMGLDARSKSLDELYQLALLEALRNGLRHLTTPAD